MGAKPEARYDTQPKPVDASRESFSDGGSIPPASTIQKICCPTWSNEGRNLSNTKRFRPFLYLLALKTSHYHQKRRREKRRRPPSLSSLPNSRIRYSATAFLLDVRPEIDSALKKTSRDTATSRLVSRCDKGTFLSLSGNTPSYPKRTDRESITPKMFERGGIGSRGKGGELFL